MYIALFSFICFITLPSGEYKQWEQYFFTILALAPRATLNFWMDLINKPDFFHSVILYLSFHDSLYRNCYGYITWAYHFYLAISIVMNFYFWFFNTRNNNKYPFTYIFLSHTVARPLLIFCRNKNRSPKISWGLLTIRKEENGRVCAMVSDPGLPLVSLFGVAFHHVCLL